MISSWSAMRKKLEKEYLAESLRGRVQYFVTTYRESHDQEGRAAILLDGKEVLQGNFFQYYLKYHLLDKEHQEYGWGNMAVLDEATLDLGMFDQRSFYSSFYEFDNQSIEKSLESDNLLVRIFAVLDRRLGKRRIRAMLEHMGKEPEILQFFFFVRAKAEGILP